MSRPTLLLKLVLTLLLTCVVAVGVSPAWARSTSTTLQTYDYVNQHYVGTTSDAGRDVVIAEAVSAPQAKARQLRRADKPYATTVECAPPKQRLAGSIEARGPPATKGAGREATGFVAQNGTKVTGYTKHGLNRAIGDGGKRAGTKASSIRDALQNPKSIKSGVDDAGRPFEAFKGNSARVVVNPETGQIVSVNPIGGAGVR